jgi:hypothetical protein
VVTYFISQKPTFTMLEGLTNLVNY